MDFISPFHHAPTYSATPLRPPPQVAVSNDLDTGDTKPTPMSVDKKSAHVEEKNQNSRDGKMKGLLLLTTVPLVWGTYAPSVKYLYEWRGDSILSPPGLVFNFACYSVSALTLAGVFWFDHLRRRWGEALICVVI